MTGNHVDDMKMIDFILGELPKDEECLIREHIEQCTICQNNKLHWNQLMTGYENKVPSKHLEKKLSDTLRRKPTYKKLFYVAGSIVAMVAIFIGIYNMLIQNGTITSNHKQQGYVIAQQDAVPEKRMKQRPDTNRLDIVSNTNHHLLNGEVLFNKKTNEIIFLAEGLIPLEASDYQMWFVHVNDNWNGQILQLRDGSVRVYYKGPDITLLKYLKVSVEPEGGSLTPTGPELFYVDFENE